MLMNNAKLRTIVNTELRASNILYKITSADIESDWSYNNV